MAAEDNALEKALRLAAAEPACRPDFYKTLMDSTVYVIGESSQRSTGARMVEAGEKLAIQNWVGEDGSPFIPFFTSIAALQEAIDFQCNYLALPARALFESTERTALFLNPKSDYGKEFFPEEIEALLSTGTIGAPEQLVTGEPTRVLLGQPREYPSRMVDSLAKLFAVRRNVTAAYLLLMHDPSVDEKPHLVIGIEADGDVEEVVQAAGVVAADTAPADEPVDLFRVVRGESGLSDYCLREVAPFYQKR